MNRYVVLYRDETLKPADPPLAFKCQGDDGDHAEEQCINAYPDCDVVFVYEEEPVDVDPVQSAYIDYWSMG